MTTTGTPKAPTGENKTVKAGTGAKMTTEPTIVIDMLGGNCPVQAEGTINGAVFYFRARGTHWALHVATSRAGVFGEDAWVHDEKYSDEPYAAGWMDEDEARELIERAAKLYAEEESGGSSPQNKAAS